VLRRRGAVTGHPTPTVALAGAGAIAAVHALAAGPAGLRITAVASAGGTSARHLAGSVDARKVSPDELPAGADVLVVATPPAAHTALALQGLAAGADVLVEKPLASTLADADRLVSAADDPGAPVLRCAENLLHAPAWRAVAARRGALGPLRHLSARTLQSPPDWGHFAGALTDGGVLFDLGPHPVALLLGLAGEVATGVRATLSSGRADGADDDARVVLRFASGLEATLEVSWVSTNPEWSVQAASDTGVLRLEFFPEVTVEADGEPVPLAAGHPGAADPALATFGYIDQLADLAAGGAHGQTASQARDVLEVICAAYASAGTDGREVALPFSGDRTRTPMQLWREPSPEKALSREGSS
jgi:UDP-N-acetyl-2-amino-2-deoxyglucuronate dehydrogenase